jgi:hypothetical protein
MLITLITEYKGCRKELKRDFQKFGYFSNTAECHYFANQLHFRSSKKSPYVNDDSGIHI